MGSWSAWVLSVYFIISFLLCVISFSSFLVLERDFLLRVLMPLAVIISYLDFYALVVLETTPFLAEGGLFCVEDYDLNFSN